MRPARYRWYHSAYNERKFPAGQYSVQPAGSRFCETGVDITQDPYFIRKLYASTDQSLEKGDQEDGHLCITEDAMKKLP